MILCLRCMWIKNNNCIYNNLLGETDFSNREVCSRSNLDQIVWTGQDVHADMSGKIPEAMDICKHIFFWASHMIIVYQL